MSRDAGRVTGVGVLLRRGDRSAEARARSILFGLGFPQVTSTAVTQLTGTSAAVTRACAHRDPEVTCA